MSFETQVLAGLDLSKARFFVKVIDDYNRLSGVYKKRKTFPQSETMQDLQGYLKTWLRKQKAVQLRSATGAVPGSSPQNNVRRHRRKDKNGNLYFPRYFYLVDLKDAYKNVLLPVLARILTTFEPELDTQQEMMEAFLEKYCSCEEGGITVGATASPDLFNIYCAVLLDLKLHQFCEVFDITYTRYLDDLTFSSNKPFGRKKRRYIRRVIQEARFPISEHKTHNCDLVKGPIVINGMGIDILGNIFTPRRFTSELRGLLHLVLTGKDTSIPESFIRGKINVFLQILRAKGRKPNMTELKMYKKCDEYLAKQKAIKKALKTRKG